MANSNVESGSETNPPSTDPDGSSPPETTSDAAAAIEQKSETAGGDSDLPEWEPLTPEIVEEEAIRGDFMLRWAAILLGVLLGWTQIADTPVLVKIRSGEYLAAHGILPPATDVFSSTATDQPWVNLGWLSDLLFAGAFAIGDAAGLTIVTALLTGAAAYFLVKAARPEVSTWWNAACVALSLVAAVPLCRAGDDVITILGLSVLMYQLAVFERAPSSAFLWRAAPLMFLWSNLDSHAFVGLAVLLAYAIGTWIGGEQEQADAKAGRLWVVLGVAFVAMMLHPFHWHVAEAPWYAYGIEYPERADYGSFDMSTMFLWGSMTEARFWTSLNVHTAGALLVAGISLTTLLLNRRALRWSHVIVWLTAVALSVFASHQLIALSVVHAVLAGLNGQDWYQANFRQEYSVELSELVFSRGGRAVTVVGMFLLGYLAVSGRLMGADARRIGFGFDPRLAAMIESYREVIEDSLDDRPFNFRLEQGDVLIWIGQKPFIDSRIVLFANSDPDVVALHQQLRPALQQPRADDQRTGQPQIWQEAFANYEITHVMPRLTGANPDYQTLFDLITDPQQRWKLAKLGAATAIFYHRPSESGALQEYVDAQTGVVFRELAFAPADDDELAATSQPIWPRPQTLYDRLLTLPRPSASNDIQLARHYNEIPNFFGAGASNDLRTMLALLAIRHARQGLLDDPDESEGYRQLAVAYSSLYQIEMQLQQSFGGVTATDLRLQQLMSALSDILVCDPDDAYAHLQLHEIQLATQKADLSLEHLREFVRLSDEAARNADDPEMLKQSENVRTAVEDLTKQIDTAREELNSAVQLGESRLEVAQRAYQRSLPGEALRILEEDQTVIASSPDAQLMYGGLLLAAGRTEEAYETIGRMRELIGQAERPLVSRWRYVFAVVNAVSGNDRAAAEIWSDEAQELTDNQLRSLLGMSRAPGVIPGISNIPLASASEELIDARPLMHILAVTNLLVTYPQPWALARYHEALVLLEQGRSERAREILEEILELEPETNLRAGVAFYLSALTGDVVDVVSPGEREQFETSMPPPPPKAVRDAADQE